MPVTVAPHTPVLVDRVAELLSAAPDGVIVDCTLGAAGHALAVVAARVDAGRATRLVGIDRDPDALALAGERLAASGVAAELVHARFDALPDVLDTRGVGGVAGVLYDLGLSSMHVDRPERGFSFAREGPLDMRMDPAAPTTAADLVNGLPEPELARLLSRLGEERFARRIAAAVVAARPLETTRELAEVVAGAVPAAARRSGPHPATRTFQALRIAVNDELDALAASLPAAVERLLPGGVGVALAYHSLEDRIVKRAFADAARGCVCPPDLPVCACGREPLADLITRRPERPSEQEVAANPRSRSARLRALRRRHPGRRP